MLYTQNSAHVCGTWLPKSVLKFLTGIVMPHERVMWDVVVLIGSIWVLLVSPLTVGFGLNDMFFYGNLLGYLELGIDWIYLSDMWVNARTVWEPNVHVIPSRR